MKKLLLATLCILICGLAFAQAPQKMSYQAVIRDNSGNLVTNQHISMRISILKETAIGSIGQPSEGRSRAGERESLLTDQTNNVEIYIETHSATTNANGLVSIEIGAGNATMGSFLAIDWSDGLYFIKTDVDLNGGTRFKTIGTSQLISVPYAMYAQKAGSAVSETDPQFNAWDKDYNDLTNRPEIPVVPTNVSAFANDANYITSADVPAQVNADWNATSGAGQILNKPEIPTVPTNVSAFTNDANYITSADVPAQVNADWNATSGAGQILNKPEIPTVPTNVSAFTNDANYITSADVPAQVNADWNATSGAGQILNKPEIPTVPTNVSAFTNDANYITSADVPAQVNADWNATSGAGQILNKPEIPTVPTNVSAFTNDANYITSADVPAQVNADWNATSGAGQILNKPEIPTVPTNVSAFTNDANYITSADVPAQVNADWNATSGAGQILNKPAIPTVPTNVSAFTNDANYITSADVPAQVNADWNATSGAGQILNKPEIPIVPTNVSAFENDANYLTSYTETDPQFNAWDKDYNDLTNRPEIPVVPTTVSAFDNDANYLTSYTETDPTISAWAKAENKPVYDYSEITNTPELFDGNYNNLTNTPDLSGYITTESQTLADAAALGNAINAQIKNLTDPTENQDAATKKYVDELIAQLQAAIDALSGSGSGSTPSGNLPAHYTVTFDANGGTGEMEPQTFTPGTVYTVPLNSFRKDEPFKCWNTSADGTGATYYTSQNMVLWSNITLYAQWGYDRFFDSRDSTYYRYITIGDQTWMADNLRYVGNIPYGGTTKASTESYWYSNNLYNWTAATSGICPTGWHLPSADEWNQLFSFLRSHSEYQCGSSNSIGKSLASTTGWISSSTDCTPGNTPSDNNSSGFNARPMGYWGSATGDGAYVGQGNGAYFWSTTEATGIQQAKYFAFGYNGFDVSLYSQGKYYAYNVRCVKD